MIPQLYVIDDADTDRELTARFLRRHAPEAEVRTFPDGLLAMEQFQRIAQDRSICPPALVMLDFRMPGLDGSEIVQRTRQIERLLGVPFVLFSSGLRDEDVRRCLALGCSSFVRKPLDYGEYEDTVRQMLGYWLNVHKSRVRAYAI